MSEIDTSGYEPAYPVLGMTQNQSTGDTTIAQYHTTGLTIRDEFAKAALTALLVGHKWDVDKLAADAWAVADAMVRARSA